MAEEGSHRSRRQRPPTSDRKYKSRRSCSISNDLEREPISQTVCQKGRTPFTTADIHFTATQGTRIYVTKLIHRFDNKASLDNAQSNIQNKNPSIPLARGNSDAANSKTIQAAKLVHTKKQNSHAEKLSVEISIHITSDSSSSDNILNHANDRMAFNQIQSNDRLVSSVIIPETTSLDLMTEIIQRPSVLNGPFIHSQSNDIPNDDDLKLPNPPDASHDGDDDEVDIRRRSELFERVRGVIEEVRKTEDTYVNKLYILSVKVPAQIKQTCERDENLIKTFNKIYKSVSHAIQELYKFHHDIILPHMEQYVTGHRQDNMWSIFQEHYQTIEDLYKAYYVAYDENQVKLGKLCESNPLIDQAMLKCRVYFDNLYPIDELNCANQRLLRYILLMKAYMKHLDESLPEYKHTRFIHDELTRIAERCEEYLAVSPSQLNKLRDRVDTKPECFDNQQLIWHGSLKEQYPRKHTGISQRYMILFSSCILVYKESGNKLEIKRQLTVKGMTVEVLENRTLELPNSHLTNGKLHNTITYYLFRINAVEKVCEFLVEKESDRDKWVNKIRQANEELERGNSSIAIRQSNQRSNEQQLGLRAPVWVHDMDVSRCQICHNRFRRKIILSRRHHCRSCGRCICGSCSTKKLILKYCQKEGEQRVCDACYTNFTTFKKSLIPPIRLTRDPNRTILFGDFYCTPQNSIKWIDLTDDYQLYFYVAKLDQVAEFCIYLPELRKISFSKATQTFVLSGKDKCKLSLEFNHQLSYQKNDYIDEKIKNTNNKLLSYADLWNDALEKACSNALPSWYTIKRHSADSGISDNP